MNTKPRTRSILAGVKVHASIFDALADMSRTMVHQHKKMIAKQTKSRVKSHGK